MMHYNGLLLQAAGGLARARPAAFFARRRAKTLSRA
jgi:hypothetical protein